MDEELKEKTRKTAELYFKGVPDQRPYALWQAFDPQLARQFSLFITGRLYAREKLDHRTRQLVTISALTVLSRPEELRLHIQAALNVGCRPEEIAETIFQTFTYAGIPTVNTALKVLKTVLEEKGLWPLSTSDPQK
jgi:4-carboxymuconolactone decarboxylase